MEENIRASWVRMLALDEDDYAATLDDFEVKLTFNAEFLKMYLFPMLSSIHQIVKYCCTVASSEINFGWIF